MRTIEVPRREWTHRLDQFSREREGWPVSLDVCAESIGAQPQFRRLSLAGVTAEPTGGGTISITVSVPLGGFLTHTIHSPAHVFMEQDDKGVDASLEVESADGTKSILQFTIGRPVCGLVRGRCGLP